MITLYSQKQDAGVVVVLKLENGRVLTIDLDDLHTINHTPSELDRWINSNGVTFVNMDYYLNNVNPLPLVKITEVECKKKMLSLVRTIHLLEI